MSRNQMSHEKFFALVEWLRLEQKAKRLDGMTREILAARASQDLRFPVVPSHIKSCCEVAQISWEMGRNSKADGKYSNVSATAFDLRQLASSLVELMNDLGVDRNKPLYQDVQKIAAMGGVRDISKNAA